MWSLIFYEKYSTSLSYLWFWPPLILGGSVISAGTIHDLRQVKVTGTGPLWNPCRHDITMLQIRAFFITTLFLCYLREFAFYSHVKNLLKYGTYMILQCFRLEHSLQRYLPRLCVRVVILLACKKKLVYQNPKINILSNWKKDLIFFQYCVAHLSFCFEET